MGIKKKDKSNKNDGAGDKLSKKKSTGESTPPVTMLTKNSPYAGEQIQRKEKRQSSSRFNISPKVLTG